jgi:hypothetical protein
MFAVGAGFTSSHGSMPRLSRAQAAARECPGRTGRLQCRPDRPRYYPTTSWDDDALVQPASRAAFKEGRTRSGNGIPDQRIYVLALYVKPVRLLTISCSAERRSGRPNVAKKGRATTTGPPGLSSTDDFSTAAHLRPRGGENRGFACQRAGRYLITRSPAKCAGGVRNVLLKRFPSDLNRWDSQRLMDERVFVH